MVNPSAPPLDNSNKNKNTTTTDNTIMTKRKRADSFQLTNADLCKSLEFAIINGNVDEVSLYAIEMANRKLNIKIIELNKNDVENNIMDSDDGIEVIEHITPANKTDNNTTTTKLVNNNKVIIIPDEDENGDEDNESFGVNCCIIQDSNENKFIYLDDVNLNMKISELKKKVNFN